MSRSNQQIMAMVQAKMETMNDSITDVELTINNSWAFSQYLKTEPENPRTFTLVYDMINQLGTVKPVTFYDIAVIGMNGQSYVSNQSSLAMPVEELLKSKITQEAKEHPNQILYRYVPNGITKNSKGGSAFIALKALTSPGSQGEHRIAVDGRTFTPPSMALWSKYPDSRYAHYRAKHRKLPKEQQMLCTDIQIPVGVPEKALVRAWNRIVSQGLQSTAAESEDTLMQYRANEMVRLISEVGRIEAFDYELLLKVLDHIEVKPEGKLAMIFLEGTRITV